MKNAVPEQLEAGRLRHGPYGSGPRDKFFGSFKIIGPNGRDLRIISSMAWKQYQWEHVSVSMEGRCPNWPEMCFVKDLFWDDDEWVIQYHPAKEDYVNSHPYCLHLWKPVAETMPKPPRIMVG